ncbi:MAG: YceD family protein [Candidatus Nitrospinota bacterium M3_3B_026]
MKKDRESPLTLKVSLIPEEGVDRRWTIPPETFAAEKDHTPVAASVEFGGRLYRSGGTVYLSGRVEGTLRLACSRCLDEFDMPVAADVTTVFMPGESVETTGGEVELTGEDMDVQLYEGGEISLYGPIRDALALAVPMSPVCAEGCRGLCPVCGANLNETECGCETPSVDPRLAELKKLKFK